MLINSISMRNFQCFYGSHEKNKIEFNDGINFIIGDNAQGKSKLWDAFYWVLYDQIFNSDTRKFNFTRQYGVKLISDKAKKESNVGDDLICEVKLHARDSQGKKFEITRMYKVRKTDSEKFDAPTESLLLIREFKSTRYEIVESDKHKNILGRVLPGHLKPYMWFQGEQVDSLMDFSDQTSLTQAVTLLSDIKIYNDLISITDKGYKKAESNYASASKKMSRDEGLTEQFNKEINILVQAVNDAEIRLGECQSNLNDANLGFDRLVNSVSEAEEKVKLKAELKEIEEKREEAKSALDNKTENLNSKLFTSSWVLKGIQPYLDKYQVKYRSYVERRHKMDALNGIVANRLPIDVPQPIYVSKMLDDQECFVCGRKAIEGSDEYKHIERLLNREKSKSKSLFKNDCSRTFEMFYNKSLEHKHLIKDIDDSVSSELESIASLRQEIEDFNDRIKEITESFGQIISDDSSSDIVAEFKVHRSNIETYSAQLETLKASISENRNLIAGIEKKRDNLVVGDIKSSIKNSKEIFKQLFEIAKNTRKTVFDNLVDELEIRANQIYQEMAKKNRSITGRLSLRVTDTNTCFPEIVDGDGKTLDGSNDSNIILIKLSLMMSVLTAKELWSKNFCLISDAPTAKMSSNYSDGFYEALGNNFQQSIVMTYDFLDSKHREKLKEFNVGKVFQIKSNYPNGDRTRRDDLHTIIEEL